MNYKNSYKFRIILFNFCFFFLCFLFSLKSVYALKVIDKGTVGSGWGSGGGSQCNSSTIWGCLTWYNSTDLKIAFRLTLVDKDGKRVPNTHSVDITGDESIYNRYESLRYVDVTWDRNIGYKFGYKYSNIYNDYEPSNNFKMFYEKVFPTRYTVKNGTFRNVISLYAPEGETPICKIENMCFSYKGYSDLYFIDWFFHVSGFLSDTDKTLGDNLSKNTELVNNGYYLLMEPTLMAQYNHDGAHRYTYGTVTEFSRDIMTGLHDQLSQNAKHIRTSAGCILVQQPIKEFRTDKMKNSSTICTEQSSNSLDWKKAQVWDIASNDYGYGMYLFSLKDVIPTPPPITEIFKFDFCSTDDEGLSDGVVTFNTYSGKNLDQQILKTDLFKVVNGDDASSVYCYDNVTYDFSEIINHFGNEKKKILTNIDVPSGTATVIRTCYVPSVTPYSTEQVRADLSDYENPGITLNLYNQSYNMTTDRNAAVISEKAINGGRDYVIKQYTIVMNYNISEDILLGKNSSGVYEASISFNNLKKIFGRSNKLVESLLSKESLHSFVPGDGAGFLKNPYNTQYSFECKFNTTVEEKNTDIQFRVISLDNPFPARDGTARLPGVNWLNENNYVNEYITNNRGVRTLSGNSNGSPETIYSKVNPMYSITLDASTMIKIRNYNSKNQNIYGDISLECDGNGRQCVSNFLRKEISQFNGDCALSKNEFSKIGTSYQINDSSFINNVQNGISNNSYNVSYDANKDGKLTDDDLIIMLNQNMNTKFYTCANKTYRSGGPVEENTGGIE